MDSPKQYTAFIDERIVACGTVEDLLPKLKSIFDKNRHALFSIFDDETGKQTDFNLRGSLDEILAREAPASDQGGRGRPRLGVIAREVTLLPRHWDWLELQPNGASAALRRLVDDARKRETAEMRNKRAMHATGRFLSAMAGNYPNYEGALRALYRGESKQFADLIARWPRDVRIYALRLATGKKA